MAFNITKAIKQEKQSFVAFEDGSLLNFTYRPNTYTPNHEDMVDEALSGTDEDKRRAGDTLRVMLLGGEPSLLASWDVVHEVPREEPDPDQPGKTRPVVDPATGEQVVDVFLVPVDEAGFNMVPLAILARIHRTIVQEMLPGEAKSTDSEGSFS